MDCQGRGTGRFTVALLVAVVWGRVCAADLDDSRIVPIADILTAGSADPPAFGKRVKIRGTVTWCDSRALVVEDDSASIWVPLWRARRSGVWQGGDNPLTEVAPGSEVEVLGLTDRAGYSPSILPLTIEVVGTRDLPPAAAFDAELFFAGFQEGKRVVVEGVVQAVREEGTDLGFVVDHYGRRFAIDVAKEQFGDDPESFIDTEVKVQGVAVAIFNQRGEFVWPKLRVNGRGDFTIMRPAPSTPFEAPAFPLHSIGTYRRQPVKGHRLRTQGIVIHVVPGEYFFLQEQAIGVRIESSSRERLAVGDRVEAVGFLRRIEPTAFLSEALYRKIGTADPPQPLPVDADALIDEVNANLSVSHVSTTGDSIGCLVTFPARLLSLTRVSDGGLLLLATNRSSLNAWAGPETFAALQSVEPGSEVQVTGVASVERLDKQDTRAHFALPFLGRLQVLLRSEADVRIIQKPSWWTPRRLSLALAILAFVAALVTGWAIMLRRQVRRQLSIIEAQLQDEAATEERKRIAREFHDTLEQDLAGVAMRLDVAAERAGDEASRTVLESQRALLERLRADTHDFLWDLRDPTRHDGSLLESLEEQVTAMQATSRPVLRFHGRGTATPVSPFVQHHLLRIVREAITNAIRHGSPKQISITVEGIGHSVAVTVEDDGTGFDVEARGTLPGHFGVRGMRERARRIDADVRITSRVNEGTVVRVVAPSVTEPQRDTMETRGVS
jgi:signal transduction histidine kinase